MDFQKDNKDTREEEKGSCLLVSVYISNKPVTHVLCTYYHYSHATDKERSKILEELGNSSASHLHVITTAFTYTLFSLL